MSLERIAEAARSYGPILDKACATACENMWREGRYSAFELRKGDEELWKLSKGQDLAYDRPSIGLHYALLYHLERTHMVVQSLIPLLADRSEPLTIYDIGSGTGATAWATAVVTRACREAGLVSPRVRLYGLDTSPFMVNATHRLWNALPENFKKQIHTEHRLGSWDDAPEVDNSDHDALIVASYLFNSSDHRHLPEMENGLARFADHVRANRLLVLLPSAKASLADEFILAGKWESNSTPQSVPVWTDVPKDTCKLREDVLRQAEIIRDPRSSYEKLMNNRGHQIVRLFKRKNQQLRLAGTTVWYRLSDEQLSIARSHAGPTYLVGPAGSGKSTVLTERLIYTLKFSPSVPLFILVTSFNKAMIEELINLAQNRISNALNVEVKKQWGNKREADWTIIVSNRSTVSTIRFLNFDKLPFRMWLNPPLSARLLNKAIFDRGPDRPASGIGTRSWNREFIRNELRLVVYGLEAMSYVDYLKVRRRGRREPLRRDHRMGVWPSMKSMLREETTDMKVLRQRMMAWLHNKDALDAGRPMVLQEPFKALTHVFVDEAQDMTRADIRMLALTPSSPRQLFLVGDSTQALHSHGIGEMPHVESALWRRPELHGSYRLPALVCDPVANMAREILADQRLRRAGGKGSVPLVSRAAVPGPRPVIVCGTDRNGVLKAMETMACFAPQVHGSGATWYVVSGGGSINEYQDLVKGTGLRVRPLDILKEKGLERPLVLFPTDYRPPSDKSKGEAVYASVTRASAVLMIAVYPHLTSRATAGTLSALDRNRDHDQLMFWNQAAKDAWHAMLRGAGR